MDVNQYKLRLKDSLSRLASPADDQIQYLRELRMNTADELALEFDDLIDPLSKAQQSGELNQEQIKAILQVNAELDLISGKDKADLWELQALRDRSEWENIRALARVALELIENV